jgi:hypothetical protein
MAHRKNVRGSLKAWLASDGVLSNSSMISPISSSVISAIGADLNPLVYLIPGVVGDGVKEERVHLVQLLTGFLFDIEYAFCVQIEFAYVQLRAQKVSREVHPLKLQ